MVTETTPTEPSTKATPDAAEGGPSVTDDLVSTRHTLTVGSRRLRYTASTGRVVLRKEVTEADGTFSGHRPHAVMSMTSYVVDPPKGRAPHERPVTFAFNGGPGSSSVWLHLGLLGPRRVDSGDVGALTPPPYGLLDNPESLLAVSDLVFIDPVSTGYSRPTEGEKAKEFHGFTADIESVAELIRAWTSRNQRWLSPKFIAGESYGTTRAAALAEHLQTQRGMYLNGLILISCALDFARLDADADPDRASLAFLPTYAAVAHYHGLLGDTPLESVLAEAREYAAGDYLLALSRGSHLPSDEKQAHAERLARLTGLSPQWLLRANLRIEHLRFFAELLRDRGLVVGRLDSRFTGPAPSGNAEIMADDPSHDAIGGSYAAAWNHYVRAELGYQSDLAYTQLSMKANEEWSFKEFEGKPVSVTSQLSRVLRANPDLRVHVAYGYTDGATPFFGAEQVIAHLDIPAPAQDRIEHCYYPAGHMMYVHEPSRIRQSADLADFVRRSSTGRAGKGANDIR